MGIWCAGFTGAFVTVLDGGRMMGPWCDPCYLEWRAMPDLAMLVWG